ncbi:MAG TPA: hypothetical protein VK066_20820 [Chloroflexota bacterium]|nr:hypothetical protein [Chloroflexota bacterium]
MSTGLTVPSALAPSTPVDEGLLTLVLRAAGASDGTAAVRALLRLAREGDASARRILLALAQQAAREAGEREGLSETEAALVAGHVLRALGRELRGGAETAGTAREWLFALAAAGARAHAAG